MPSTLDLSFLEKIPNRRIALPRPVNFFDILREGRLESRVDMTLQFFLDPTERHGLGSLVIDSLLEALSGARFIGPNGRSDRSLDPSDYQGSNTWNIETQSNRIDVLATNTDLGLAIALENKIGHRLDNPLHIYAKHVFRQEFSDVLLAVLAPEYRVHIEKHQRKWISKSVTYDDLFREIRKSPALVDSLLDPKNSDQKRSLDLLQQFIEARSTGETVSSLHDQNKSLTEWRTLLMENERQINAFFAEKSRAGALLRDRRKRIEPLIESALKPALEQRDLMVGWEAHGGSENAYNAYDVAEIDRTFELKFGTDPNYPLAYFWERRSGSGAKTSINRVELLWTDTDEDLVRAFVDHVLLTVDDLLEKRQP